MEALLLWVCVLACACAGAAGLDDEMAELARMLRETCVAETGVDAALIDAVNGGADLTPDPQLKCYIKCFMETAGMLSEGAVDEEAVLGALPDALRRALEPTVRKCGTQRGADDCDTAYLTHACWQQNDKANYFLV